MLITLLFTLLFLIIWYYLRNWINYFKSGDPKENDQNYTIDAKLSNGMSDSIGGHLKTACGTKIDHALAVRKNQEQLYDLFFDTVKSPEANYENKQQLS